MMPSAASGIRQASFPRGMSLEEMRSGGGRGKWRRLQIYALRFARTRRGRSPLLTTNPTA